MIKYGTGKAGQYAKAEAQKRFEKRLLWVVIIALVAGILLGVPVGVYFFPLIFKYLPWTRQIPFATYASLVIGLFVFALVAETLLFRALRGPIDKITSERVKWLRGGQTEGLIAYELRDLDDNWHLFNGIAMKGGGDVDHVLLGPGGLFCISTKGTRGIYSLNAGNRLMMNGEPSDDAAQAQRLAMTLRHWLEARLQPDNDIKAIPYVQPILAAPFMHVAFKIKAMNVWVVDESELYQLAVDEPVTLKPATIRGCVRVLKELTGWDEHGRSNAHNEIPTTAHA